MRHHPPMHASRQADARPRYPAASTMNPAIGKRFEGLDVEGVHVTGRIYHVGNYGKNGQPITWALLLDDPHDSRTVIVTAQAVQEHLDGLAFVRSMGTGDD